MHDDRCQALRLFISSLVSDVCRAQVQREVRLQVGLNHPGIIGLLGAFEDEQHVYLVQVRGAPQSYKGAGWYAGPKSKGGGGLEGHLGLWH